MLSGSFWPGLNLLALEPNFLCPKLDSEIQNQKAFWLWEGMGNYGPYNPQLYHLNCNLESLCQVPWQKLVYTAHWDHHPP